MDWENIIPVKFYNLRRAGRSNHPFAENVAQLIELLKELPGELKIENGFSNGTEVVVYNVGTGEPHLEFTEPEDDDEGDWE